MNCLTGALGCLVVLVVMGIVLRLLILHAPEGYQKDGYFFYGEQKK